MSQYYYSARLHISPENQSWASARGHNQDTRTGIKASGSTIPQRTHQSSNKQLLYLSLTIYRQIAIPCSIDNQQSMYITTIPIAETNPFARPHPARSSGSATPTHLGPTPQPPTPSTVPTLSARAAPVDLDRQELTACLCQSGVQRVHSGAWSLCGVVMIRALVILRYMRI